MGARVHSSRFTVDLLIIGIAQRTISSTFVIGYWAFCGSLFT